MHADTTGTDRTRLPGTARIAAVAVVVAIALATAACSSGSSTTSTTSSGPTATVKPPNLTLAGCNYEIDGTVPPGMNSGIQPTYPAFTPNQAADEALGQIKAHGGTALVDGFTIPPGVKLYAGPDSTTAPVATVEQTTSLILAEPVLWTTASGQQWLATFLACGGQHLYWIDVAQIGKADPNAGTMITNSIDLAKSTTFSPTNHTVTTLPIVIGPDDRFALKGTEVSFAIARGELQGF